MLERLICSLIDTAGSDERYEILVQIDTDDPAWIDREPHMHSKVRYMRRPRPITLGEKLNEMARVSTGEILWFIANDCVMETNGWPKKFREAAGKLPNGMGVPFVKDPLHPGHSSYPLVTRRMMEVIGFAYVPLWPYWFCDTWYFEIGVLLGVYFEFDVEISSPEGRGKTHGMVDLPFWVAFFQDTRPMRVRDAIRLAEVAFGKESRGFTETMAKLGERQQFCVQATAHLSSPEFLAAWGDNAESPPSPKYEEVKKFAELQTKRLKEAAPRSPRVAIAFPSGRQVEATMATSLAALCAYSAVNGITCCVLNVQSSDPAHGRNSTVEIAMREGCDYIMFFDSDMKFPPDTLIRLMRRDKDICGATYNKRVRSEDGTYQTLGKFVGDKPPEEMPDLHEALLLPGGVILIKIDVFKAVKWPWYAFAYRFPGEDKLEAFKDLMRNYFYGAPPEDVLAELDGTRFGEWMRSGYVLGEYGEDVTSFSEDLWACRRFRKAGYKIWCDLSLTYEIGHIGETVISCVPPEQAKLQEAAD